MVRKVIKFMLAIISIMGLFLLLFTIGGMDAGMFTFPIGRIMAGIALFGFPIGILALAEAHNENPED